VFIAEPPPTPFDLHFQVFGFPVRVHPFFWLMALLLGFGGGGGENVAIHLVIWFFAIFVSILIHELGHSLLIRHFGRPAYIVLYAMGGLAVEGRPRHEAYASPWSFDSYSEYSPRSRLPTEQILISAAGPGIQFLLAALLVAGIYGTGGRVHMDIDHLLPIPVPVLGGAMRGNENLSYLAFYLLQVNIFWPLLNLLPMLPLDGGQIAAQIFLKRNPYGGMQQALWLSLVTSGVMAVVALVLIQDFFLMLLFASLAVSSYLALQQMGGQRPW